MSNFSNDPSIVQYAADYYIRLLNSYIKGMPACFTSMPTVSELLKQETKNINFNIALAYWFIAKSTKNIAEANKRLDDVKKYCNLVLNDDERHIKSLALKSKAFVEQSDDESAKVPLRKLHTIDPHNELFESHKFRMLIEEKDAPKKDPYLLYKNIIENDEEEKKNADIQFELKKAKDEAIDEELNNVWNQDFN